MKLRIAPCIAFVIFFLLLFIGYTDSRVEGQISVGPESEEISIFDPDAGAQTNSLAIDIFSSFLISGVGGTGSLYLAYPSVYSGAVGTKVTLTGDGFSSLENTVHFGNLAIASTYAASTEISFIVPIVPIDTYNVFVSNNKGNTGNISFTVRDPKNVPPVIDFLSPSSGVGRATVVIHGSGFSKTTGNTVLTGYGTLKNVISPEGTTLTISILPPNYSDIVSIQEVRYVPNEETAKEAQQFITDLPEDMWIYVSNENGFSNPAIYQYYYDKTTF